MEKRILGLGNAVLDMIAESTENELAKNNLQKGSMTLVQENQSEQLRKSTDFIKKTSGGSVANTLVGVSMLGKTTFFCGKVKNDDLGNFFKRDMEESGTKFLCKQSESGLPTARCLVFVTPDGERTMQTFLGASTTLDEVDISESFFQQVEIVLIEGYLWSSPSARKAITKVINIAHKKKIKVMFSLSNHNLVELFRKDFLELVENHVDILIGNELEFFEMFKSKDDKIILSEMKDKIDVGIMTKGERGAMIFENNYTLEVKPLVVENVIDTTGAGDMFAAGFLSKIIDGKNALEAANFGCKVAARIITQYGARPSKELIGDLTRDEN